jgi:hypothetical protein
MMTYRILETDRSHAVLDPAVPSQRYAWLEHEGGLWHFLTNLFEDPGKSLRSWTDEQHALEDLEREGWVVVYPYNEHLSMNRTSGDRACGYGLMWIDPHMVS